MQIKRDFEYYHNLHNLVTHALLHLLSKVSETARHVPVSTRNEILIRYLKPKVTNKGLSNIKKDIKLMLNVARKQGGNLEMRLFEEGSEAETGILYMIEDQIEHGFDHEQKQVAPLSMLIQLERAPKLIDSINQHGLFLAEMKE